MDINKSDIEALIKEILIEKLNTVSKVDTNNEFSKSIVNGGVASVKLSTVNVDESNRLDTGNGSDKVYTKDVFSLSESPKLGCGIMVMTSSTFDWTLGYDEIDYVIEGTLNVIINGRSVTANAGEIILIPKGSKIKFSVPDFARFMYVTYPADWAAQ